MKTNSIDTIADAIFNAAKDPTAIRTLVFSIPESDKSVRLIIGTEDAPMIQFMMEALMSNGKERAYADT